MGRLSASSTGSGKGAFFFKVRGGIIMEDQGFFQAILMIGRRHKNLSLLIFFYLFIFIYLSIYLTLAKWDIQYQYTVKNSFPYKNKMLIKANGAIKSIMNKNVKTNK